MKPVWPSNWSSCEVLRNLVSSVAEATALGPITLSTVPGGSCGMSEVSTLVTIRASWVGRLSEYWKLLIRRCPVIERSVSASLASHSRVSAWP